MKPTKQDKRDIKETILWLGEAVEWCINNPPEIDEEPNWENNVIEAVDSATEWLQKIEKGEIK